MHPEVAGPYVITTINDYVSAGIRLSIQPDWDRFVASEFYELSCAKYTQSLVDREVAKARSVAKWPTEPKRYPDSSTAPVVELVIRDYVNAGLMLSMPNWDRFRQSQFYDACVFKFGKDETEAAIAKAKEETDKLNKPLR